jgi:hypothetical protein
MDAFERVVASLLERDGYWIRPSYKVELTSEEKRLIGRPSSPRWELDLVGYRGGENRLIVVECKSYLDSRGVAKSAFDGTNARFAGRFKLFTDSLLRKVVLGALVRQLELAGACASNPALELGLAAGRIASDADREWLRGYFDQNGWFLWDEDWISHQLQQLGGSYENDIAAIVAKLILRRVDSSVISRPATGATLVAAKPPTP